MKLEAYLGGTPAMSGCCEALRTTTGAVEDLRHRLFASGSATRTLKAWCADHRIGDGPIQSERHAVCHAVRPDEALLHALTLAPGEELRHRKVTLIRGALALADCELWWVPARLDPEMVRALEMTATPFGAVVAPLRTARQILFEALPPPGGTHVLEHRAVLLAGRGGRRAIAAVRELYRSTLVTACVARPFPGGLMP